MKKLFLAFVFFFNFELPAQITITRPLERAVYQRNNQNVGYIETIGSVSAEVLSLEAKLIPMEPGQGAETSWQPIKIENGRFKGKITGSGGFYRVVLRKTTSKETSETSINNVGIGEVFLVAGQSNTMVAGPYATDKRVLSVSYALDAPDYATFVDLTESKTLEKWIYPSNSIRAFMGSLGDLLVKRLNVPVLFMCAGASGTNTEAWFNGIVNNTEPYTNLNKAIQRFGKEYGMRSILWHQGETNSIFLKTPAEKYQKELTTVINKSRFDLNFNNLAWMVARVSWSKFEITGLNDPNDPNPIELRNETIQGQNNVISSVSNVFAGPNTDVLEGYNKSELRIDGVHFSEKGMQKNAELWSTFMNEAYFRDSKPFQPNIDSKSNQTLFFNPIESKAFNDVPFFVLANSTANLPISYTLLSGPATMNNNRITLTGQTGFIQIQASQNGNAETSSAASIFLTIQVKKPSQFIQFQAIPNKSIRDSSFLLVANSSSTLPILFRIIKGSATVLGNKVILQKKEGKVEIEASQSGNENYEAALAVRQTFQIEKLAQAVEFTKVNAKIFDGKPIAISAFSSANLPITYQITGGSATLNGLELSVQKPSVISLEAFQNGNEVYKPAGAVMTFEVYKQKQTITLGAITEKSHLSSPFTIDSKASSNLEVQLKIIEGPAKITANTIQLTGKDGKVIIEASQAGNDFFESNSARTEFIVYLLLSDEITDEEISIFPNPAVSKLYLKSNFIPKTAEIIDLKGNIQSIVFQTANKNTVEFNIEKFNSGIYFLKITTPTNQIYSRKFIVLH